MSPIKVAIVGSEEKYWTHPQKRKAWFKIMDILEKHAQEHEPVTLVSGGCHLGGVDIWAEIIATTMGIHLDIKLPEIHQWGNQYGKKGFKTRNEEVAENCDILYLIDPPNRGWSGGRWTYNYAQKIGKDVVDLPFGGELKL